MRKILLFFIIFIIFVFDSTAQTKEAYTFDKFGALSCDDLKYRLSTFMEELQKNKDSKGYVMVYEGKYSGGKFPLLGESTLLSQYMLRQFKDKRFPTGKYLFISGGIKEKYSVELWIVPKYAKPPIPEPTFGEIKYRNGKLPKLESICN